MTTIESPTGSRALAVICCAVVAWLGATAASGDDSCLVERGRVARGPLTAVAVDPPLLLYGSGSSLVIEDVSDPRRPHHRGLIDLGSAVVDQAVGAGFAYVTTNRGLHVVDVDVDDPTSPVEVGFVGLGFPARAVAVSGSRAWVAGGSLLTEVDVSDPTTPSVSRIDRCDPPCDYRDLAVDGDLLHAIGRQYWLRDVDDPTLAGTLGHLNIYGHRVAADRPVAVALSAVSARLVDTADPARPVVRGSVLTHGVVHAVALLDGIAMTGSDEGVTVIDTSGSGAPSELSFLATADPVTSLAALGETAYAASGDDILVFDLEDPTAPEPVGRTGNPLFIQAAVSGRIIAAVLGTGWWERWLEFYRISIDGLDKVGQWRSNVRPTGVAIAGETAFALAFEGLVALDLGDPSEPTEIGFVELMSPELLAIDGGHAFTATTGAGGNGWFEVVDISDPAAMTRQGSLYWDRPDPAKRALDARNGTAVIADGAGLLVIDVSDPWRPREVGRWSSAWTRDVAVVGDLAVVSLGSWASPGDTGAVVISLADPANPAMVGGWPAPSAVLSVVEYGGAVAVGTESDGIFILDLDDPASPAVAHHWESGGRPVDELGSAWPTVVATHSDTGLTVLGLDRSCLPPRPGSSRPGPAQGPPAPVTEPSDAESASRILGRTSGSRARPGSASAVVTPK